VPQQLVLPLSLAPALSRDDFIVGTGNAQAVAFLDAWPDWPVAAAAIHGPTGSGKSHLAAIWQSASGATLVAGDCLGSVKPRRGPLIVDNVDAVARTAQDDAVFFGLLESATPREPVLLTAREPPSAWASTLPDLHSRFLALLALPVWAPDDALLAAIAGKLFADRGVIVPPAVIARVIRSVERSPDSIRAFVARADAKALSEGRAVNLALVREILTERETGLS
jgi:chromosomal replication initiation ATPase DnaA